MENRFKGYHIPLPRQYPLWKPEEVKIAEKILKGLMLSVAVPALILSGQAGVILMKGLTVYAFRKLDFNREVKRLQKRGYVSLTKTPDGFLVRLLKKGRARQKKIAFINITLPRPADWDKKWRLYTFDIPEKNKISRDLLRKKLKDLGMYNFQRSVFAYPYDCRKELEFIAGHYGLTKHASYVEASYIDIDRELRRFFKTTGML